MSSVRYKIGLDVYGDPVAKAFHVTPAMKVGCYNVTGTDGSTVYPRNLSARDLDAAFHLTLESAWRRYFEQTEGMRKDTVITLAKHERNVLLARKALHDLGVTTP